MEEVGPSEAYGWIYMGEQKGGSYSSQIQDVTNAWNRTAVVDKTVRKIVGYYFKV